MVLKGSVFEDADSGIERPAFTALSGSDVFRLDAQP